MANRQSKTAKRSSTQNGKRTVDSDVFTDSAARNVMENQPKLTPKSTKRQLPKSKVKQQQSKIRLYGAHNGTEYKESQLDIPVLNRAIIPGLKVKKGKKGKKFVDDKDSSTMNLLVKSINDKYDQVNESKLEKSRRLEEIRELRRKEMERKEDIKKGKLEDMKQEIRSKANIARANRRKNAKKDVKSDKKKVSFA